MREYVPKFDKKCLKRTNFNRYRSFKKLQDLVSLMPQDVVSFVINYRSVSYNYQGNISKTSQIIDLPVRQQFTAESDRFRIYKAIPRGEEEP
jgi:hypothetical protein